MLRRGTNAHSSSIGIAPSEGLEPSILVGTRITYQATGDADDHNTILTAVDYSLAQHSSVTRTSYE